MRTESDNKSSDRHYRLLSRICPGEGQLEIKSLYDRYKFECLEGSDESPVAFRIFIDHLTALFPEAEKSRNYVGQIRQTTYKNISVIPDSFIQEQLDFSAISDLLLKEGMKIFNSVPESISCQLSTGCISNGNEIQKEVTFNKDGAWTCSIGNVKLDLSRLGIDTIFKLTEKGIHLVCCTVRKLKLCSGVAVSSSILVSRFHVIEQLQLPGRDRSTRVLRSLSCNKAIKFNSQSDNCILCQKMTFGSNKKQEASVCNEPSTTKSDFLRLIPGASDEMLDLLMDQAKNSARNVTGRRWSKNIISICLQLYSRSPHGYEALRACNILVLPSPSLLILYKNAVKQDIGFQDNIFKWMYEEASRKNLEELGWSGGLIFDEMAIQEDLEINKSGDSYELKGYIDMGEGANMCHVLRQGNKKKTLGTHILQILFLGLTGFRFPVAHFVTHQVQGPELFFIFWEAVNKIERYGFRILYTCMDGAQCNRNFMHIHTDGIGPRTFSIPSPCSFRNIVFMMDFSHGIKKIRNNILKSGVKKGSTRILMLQSGFTVQWQMFTDAFDWDQQNCLSIHRKLTHAHMCPNNQEKMRNHLAEEVLNSDMLHLMQEYRSSLGEKGDVLSGVIEFLEITSSFIEFFRDMRPITVVDDNRLQQLQVICDWFDNWKKSADESKSKDRYKHIMSLQCHEDIQACGIGFIELCKQVLPGHTAAITPGLINSDVVENHFNQQRSTYHGANTNPSVKQYCNAQNSVIVGQSAISKKANAARGKENTMPYGVLTKEPLRKKRSKPSMPDTVPKKLPAIRF